MDAIILCLGGRANSTGRQAAAKTFIKTNSEYGQFKFEIFFKINSINNYKQKKK